MKVVTTMSSRRQRRRRQVTVRLRPLRRDDTAVDVVFAGLSAHSRYLARDLGYRELYGDALRENTGVVRLPRSVFPGSRTTWADGVVRVSCPLHWASSELTHEDLLADLVG